VTWVTFRTGTVAGSVAVTTDASRDSGLAYGSVGMFQIVAWRGPFTTWDAAYSAWLSSTNSSVILGASNPMILGVSMTSTSVEPALQGLESFALQSNIPEPSVLSLAPLAIGIMLVFRCRKRADEHTQPPKG
jgi:hypothetical protein